MTGLYTALTVAALSTLGTGVTAYSQNQNMRKQDQQAADSIRQQQQINSQAENAVGNLNKSVARSTPQDAQNSQTAAYVKALQDASATQGAAIPNVKGGSKRYDQAVTDSRADVNNYARQTASSLAATAAPQLQRIGEGQQIANVASDLGRYNDQSGAEQGLLKTQLAGDMSNPWLDSVGGLLNGAAAGYSTYAGSKRGQKAPPPPGG